MPHEPKFVAFLDAYPSLSGTGGSTKPESSASERDKYVFIIQLIHEASDIVHLRSLLHHGIDHLVGRR